MTAFSAAGFTLGALYRSRFAAALAAFGGFLVMTMSSQTGFGHTSGWALILPTNSNGNYQPVSGIFYPYLPDLPIARVMFLAGIAVVAISLLGLPASAGGPILRRAAGAVTIAGVALTATAIGLAATARIEPNGMVIPALHDAASDRPIPYTPVCGSAAGIPVCLNPAYRGIRADVASALGPVLGEVAGLPGAPVRAAQVAGAYSSTEGEDGQAMTISGHPLVLRMPLDAENLPGVFGGTRTQFTQQMRLLFVHVFVGASDGPGTPAQQAVQAAMLDAVGVPFAAQPKVLSGFGLPSWVPATGPSGSAVGPGPARGPVYTAARRLAALPAAARHAWLASHLASIQAGRLSLAELP